MHKRYESGGASALLGDAFPPPLPRETGAFHTSLAPASRSSLGRLGDDRIIAPAAARSRSPDATGSANECRQLIQVLELPHVGERSERHVDSVEIDASRVDDLREGRVGIRLC